MVNMNIGIIGTGFGKTIAQVLKAVGPTCNIFLVGNNPEKTKRIANDLSAAGTYPDWKSLIADPKIDIVVIASPSHLHREMFETAVANNKHILLEKPAATSASDIDAMAKLAEGYDKIIAINHEVRFHPIVQYLKNLIDEKKLGDILTVRQGAYLNLFSSPDYHGGWYNEKDKGGGQIFAIGSHQIDLALYLLNEPEIVSGSIQTSTYHDPKFTVEVTADSQFVGHFKTKSGASLQMFNDTYCFGYKDIIIEIVGSKGIALYSDTQGLRVSFANSEPLKSIEADDPLASIAIGNSILTKAMKYHAVAFLEAVTTNRPNSVACTLEQARGSLEAIERYLQ